jgi:glycosyltransferase involved in cell wall biosynthesis
MKQICVMPQVSGVGGMVSFRAKFTEGLGYRGIDITHDSRSPTLDSILVIGGTREIPALWRAKRRGVRIVQRLNGMNWLHRLRFTDLKHYLKAEYGNLILRIIRNRLADHIIYQSEFARQWWERTQGPTSMPYSVVHNAVNLETFSPINQSTDQPSIGYQFPTEGYRLLLVEGSLMGGYELGLESAVQLVEILNDKYLDRLGEPASLMVAGRVSEEVKEQWVQRSNIPLEWAGLVPHERIPVLDRSAHLLYSSDINAACPNSVIEALACGLPVLAFDTGALPELVTADSGRIVPYGGNPWRLEQPDVPALAEAAVEILTNQPHFRVGARTRAEVAFGLDQMLDSYLQALSG